MHPRPAIRAARVVEDGLDTLSELIIRYPAGREAMLVPVIEGGPGDLEQLARLGDVAALHLLRLDEPIPVHRVSRAKKATALFKISRSSRASRRSLRSCATSARSTVVKPSARTPSSRSACLTHSRTAVSVSFNSRATPPAVLPGWRTSATTSALNSGVNDRRGRGFFFAMVSMMGILSGASPLMVDVRQTGSSPVRSLEHKWRRRFRQARHPHMGGHPAVVTPVADKDATKPSSCFRGSTVMA